jgi:hypothetical protein
MEVRTEIKIQKTIYVNLNNDNNKIDKIPGFCSSIKLALVSKPLTPNSPVQNPKKISMAFERIGGVSQFSTNS